MPVSEIEKDLVKHMEVKIKRAIEDYLLLCDAAEIPLRESVPGALSSLLYITSHIAALSCTMTAEEFGEICVQAFSFESHKKERRHDRGE